LTFYPTGSSAPRSAQNYAALYLSCLDLPESSFLTSAFALGILQNGEPNHSRSQDHRLKNRLKISDRRFSKIAPCWGDPDFLSHELSITHQADLEIFCVVKVKPKLVP
jgi:hypothetical protein